MTVRPAQDGVVSERGETLGIGSDSVNPYLRSSRRWGYADLQARIKKGRTVTESVILSSTKRDLSQRQESGRVRARPMQRFGSPKQCHLVHSMTRSARRRIDCGSIRPIAWAARRLTISSNRVGRSIGSSLGLAPLKMRST